MKKTDKLSTFKFHCVKFTSERGDQAYGDCIFCGGVNKLYVNKNNGLWDCKRCGLKGNVSNFLEAVSKRNKNQILSKELDQICINRKLPRKAFDGIEIGVSGTTYTLAVRDGQNKVVDIRTFQLGGKIKGTAGCNVGLFNLHELGKHPITDPIYLCEGEWDGIAMRWLLGYLKKPGAVMSVPGANTFKTEWAEYFKGRTVYTLYDADEAGKDGELTVSVKLQNFTSNIYFTHWEECPIEGYDIRDLIVEYAIKRKKPTEAFEKIVKMAKTMPRKSLLIAEAVPAVAEKCEKVTIEEVYKVVDKWLFLPDHTGLDIILATILSTRIPGDPIWIFLVAPPGGTKTELLNSTSRCPQVYMTSSLTANTLISGAMSAGGVETSLLPRLNMKTLVIKDFTSIMSMPDMTKNEIFGQFRDAYDGHTRKEYGTGTSKSFKSHFSVIAGVTTDIHHLGAQYTSLGERFLKVSIGDNMIHLNEKDIIRRALKNVGQEDVMREEISGIVKKFIDYKTYQMENGLIKMPVISNEISEYIVHLAQLVAKLRGSVVRDKYNSDVMLSKPSVEFGTRLAKGFKKVGISTAILRDRPVVTMDEYRVCCKIAMDTLQQRNDDIVRYILKETATIDDTLKTVDIVIGTKYSNSTVQRILGDMHLLGVVDRLGKNNAHEWTLSEEIRELIKYSGVYKRRVKDN